jgi:hypothetical protein
LERDRPILPVVDGRGVTRVPAVHQRVGEPELLHQLVDDVSTSRRRACERYFQVVGRAVVRLFEHPAEEPVEARPRPRRPVLVREHRDRDRELQRGRSRQSCPCVPGGATTVDQVLDVDGARPAEAFDQLPYLPGEDGVLVGNAHRR